MSGDSPDPGPTACPPLSVGELSDVGRTRDENQDALGHRLDDDVALFVVCDGMGGHAGGSTASHLALETILDEFGQAPDDPIRERLQTALTAANAAVFEKSNARGPLKGMGTTVVALAIDRARSLAHICHVGDSRAYLLRRNRLVRLTRDHSMVQILVDDGLLSEEEAVGHPHANVISRSLGNVPKVEADFEEPMAVRDGDRFLLCTDGLTGPVKEAEIAQLAWEHEPQPACQALVDLANERGGADNISVHVVQVGVRPQGERPADFEIVHPPVRRARRPDTETTETGGRVLDLRAGHAEEPAPPAPAKASERAPAPAPGAPPPEEADDEEEAGEAGADAPASAADGDAEDEEAGQAAPGPGRAEAKRGAARRSGGLLPAVAIGIAIGLLAFLAVYFAVVRLESQ